MFNDAESTSSDIECSSKENYTRNNVARIKRKFQNVNENNLLRDLNYDSDIDVDVASMSTISTLASTTDRRMRFEKNVFNISIGFDLFNIDSSMKRYKVTLILYQYVFF